MAGMAGEPAPGSALTLLVTCVELYAEVPLVRLWGSVEEQRAQYVRLRADMEAAAPLLERGLGSGARGDWYLVELGGVWQRCRLLSRPDETRHSVFLLDQGRTVEPVSSHSLARSPQHFLRLPPELLCCVMANVAPADGPSARWSPAAMRLLGALPGQRLAGTVRQVLPQQRVLVLEVPVLARQLQDLGLACLMSEPAFRQSCLPLLGCSGLAEKGVNPPQVTDEPRATPSLDYFYPLLQTGGAEPVLVTQVWAPGRVFCQLRSLSQEIQRLSDSMYHYYESKPQAQGQPLPELLGHPCAARGADGRWHRALIRQIFPKRDLVQVIHVDFGRRELVPRGCLRPLLSEYFRMPVVTYPCALFGVSESASGCWSPRQVNELQVLLLGQQVSARVDYYSSYEGVYFVTLYGEDGQNLNSLFNMQAHCLSEAEGDGSTMWDQGEASIPPLNLCLHPTRTGNTETAKATEKHPELANPTECGAGEEAPVKHSTQRITIQGARRGALPASELKAAKSRRMKTSCPKRRELRINAFYDAIINFIHDPSTLWLRAGKDEDLHFTHTMNALSHHYSHIPKLEKILMQPLTGEPCCAKLGAHFYRATVVAINGKIIEVYFWDTGNTEMVDLNDVKELEPQFNDPPPFAIKCSLADVAPLGKSWSREATDFLKKIVLNRPLVIQVLAKEDDRYVIDALDESREGERNISNILARAGLARYQEFEAPLPVTKLHSQVQKTHIKQSVKGNTIYTGNAPLENQSSDKTIKSSLTQPQRCNDSSTRSAPALGQAVAEISNRNERTSPKPFSHHPLPASEFQGQTFEIGSVLDVQVTYVETPGLFWCQVANTGQELKSLMHNIQDYCKKSATPYQWNKLSCLAKYSENGKWYRAVITSNIPLNGVPPEGMSHVDVVYVDFGNKETVSTKNLKSIDAGFLNLRPQAFKCSLYNLIQPIGEDPFVWDEKAIASFQEFVNAGHVELKCTIFALASVHNELFNVVDLNTPFHSVGRHLTEHGLARSKHLLEPSVCLHSYYYSTHDIKIGSEEVVFVTHIENPCEFYCQLERNSCAIEQLSSTVTLVGNSLKPLLKSQNIHGPCLAKYIDQQWYRGMLRGTDRNQEVFFVDFGNKERVAQSDICPVPKDAYDILLQPMQAIKCGLSDIPIGAAEQVTVWFKKTVMDTALKAVVVAKDMSGKLLVELYDGTVQINAQTKEKLGSLCTRDKKSSVPAEQGFSKNIKIREEQRSLTYTSKADERKTLPPEFKEHLVKRSPTYSGKIEADQASKHKLKEEKLPNEDIKYSQRTSRDSSLTNCKKSIENKWCRKLSTFGNNTLLDGTLPHKQDNLNSVWPIQGGNRYDDPCPPLYKLCDLPQKNIVPGLKKEVYISYINDPSDFNVQFSEDEAQIAGVSDKLNESKHEIKNLHECVLQAGDVICAMFPEDCLWYRAVIKEKCSDGLHVEYLDYGNTAVIDTCKTQKLADQLSSIPVLSIRCSLSGLDIGSNWTPEAMSYFSQKSSEQLHCEFVQPHEQKWEIHLLDSCGIVIRDLINLLQTNDLQESEPISEDLLDSVDVVGQSASGKSSEDPKWTDVKMFKWKCFEIEQTVDAYASAVDGPDYFWCQCAEAKDIDILAGKLQDAGEELGNNAVSVFDSGDPCMVKYSEDKQWYRAIIRDIKGDQLTVTFVDYGNEETVGREAARAIPVDLLMIPVQAFPCCLWGFDEAQGSWTPEGINIFYDIAADDTLELTVVEVRTYEDICEAPLSLVKLQCKGKSINAEMTRFWQQIASDSADERPTKENLETLVLPPASQLLTDNVCITKELLEESKSSVDDNEPSSVSLQEGNDALLVDVSSSLLTAEPNGVVLPPLLFEFAMGDVSSTESFLEGNDYTMQDVEASSGLWQEKHDNVLHGILPGSDSLQGTDATVLLPPLNFAIPTETVCLTEELLKESDRSMEDPVCSDSLLGTHATVVLHPFVTEELPKENSSSMQDVPRFNLLPGADAIEVLPSLNDELPAETGCTGELLKESDPSLEYLDLLPGTDAAVVLHPFEPSTDTVCLTGELPKENDSSMKDVVPGLGSLCGADANEVIPLLMFELPTQTVSLTGELQMENDLCMQDIVVCSDSSQEDHSSALQATVTNSYLLPGSETTSLLPLSIELPAETVCVLELQEQHDCCQAIVSGLDSLQEEHYRATQDILPSSNSSQDIDALFLNAAILFAEETENHSIEIHKTENQIDGTCVNVFEEKMTDFISETNEAGKCQPDIPFLTDVEITPFLNKEHLEIEQSVCRTVDICEEGSGRSKGEKEEQRTAVDDEAEIQVEKSLSNIRMSEDDSEVEEEDTWGNCDAETVCLTEELLKESDHSMEDPLYLDLLLGTHATMVLPPFVTEELLKENSSSMQDVSHFSSLPGADGIEVLPSLTDELPAETVGCTGELLKESDPSLEYIVPCLDLLPGTDVAVVLHPFELSEETVCLTGELPKENGSMKDVVPGLGSLRRADATVVSPHLMFELPTQTVGLTGELQMENDSSVQDIVCSDSSQDHSSALQDTVPNSYLLPGTETTSLLPLSIELPAETVCVLELQEQHDYCQAIVSRLDSLQEGHYRATQDILPSSNSLQDIDALFLNVEFLFAEETENHSIEIHKTENQIGTCVNVFEGEITDFISETSEADKCQPDIPFLTDVEITPFHNKEHLEIEQSVCQTVDICEEGSGKSKGENEEQRTVVDDEAEVQVEEKSLSNILLSKDDSQAEEEDTGDCDAETADCWLDYQITSVPEENPESKTASSSDTHEEGSSLPTDLSMDYHTSTPWEDAGEQDLQVSQCRWEY